MARVKKNEEINDTVDTKPKKGRKKKEETGTTPSVNPEQTQGMAQMFQMFQMFMSQMQGQQQSEVKPNEDKKVRKSSEKLTRNSLRKSRGEEEIEVASVVDTVTYRSRKSGMIYNWLSVGDVEWMPIDEVLQMHSSSSKFLTAPWLTIEDEEVKEVLNLVESSDNIEILMDLDTLFDDYSMVEIKKMLESSTKGFKESFTTMVMEKIRKDELRDTLIIRELGLILNVDFDLYK